MNEKTKTVMRLWLIRPRSIEPKEGIIECAHRDDDGPWDCWPDTAVGFVVRAASEQEARSFADENAGYEKSYGADRAWLDDALSSCEELSPNGETGLIMRDFRRG